MGRYRETERDRPIDAAGGYTTLADSRSEIGGPGELAEFLANSDDAHRAFVRRAFQHFVKQPPAAYGADTLDRLIESFRANDHNVRELLVEIAVTVATHTEPVENESNTPQDEQDATPDDAT